MGLLKQFFGQSPERYELKGDRFFDDGLWGHAKIEYEKALDTFEDPFQVQNDIQARLQSPDQRLVYPPFISVRMLHADPLTLLCDDFEGDASFRHEDNPVIETRTGSDVTF